MHGRGFGLICVPFIISSGNGVLTNRSNVLLWIYNIWNNKELENFALPDIFPLSEDSWALSEVLTFSGIAFVLAHEFGHIIHGHTSYSNDSFINHQMEFQADQIAMETTFKYSFYQFIVHKIEDTYFMKFMLFGPYLVLNILALFEINNSRTHPSIKTRMEKLNIEYEKFAKKYLGEEHFQVFMSELDIDYFDRMKKIAEIQLERHLIYSKELDTLKME